MDVAASDVPMNLESVAMTSMVDEPKAPPAKKQRFGDEMNRVAEIVLVLSALGKIRGGENPTELELELMVEARSKLAGMCQEFTPKDIIGEDDIRAVIEDLGLNGKLKDPRLGFRAPKLTISEKLSLGKRKMEEAKKYHTQTVSTGYGSHLSQPNGNVASPGLAKNVSITHQFPSSEVSSVNMNGSHFRMERPQMMINGASQGTPTSSANYFSKSWSTQPQSTISFSTAPEKKVPIQSSVRVADSSFRPFMSQTPHGSFPGTNQPVQRMHYGQNSSFGSNHSEIGKIIHQVLQPLVKQYPLWNPPSRDYMSKAMTCQMCEVIINEVETLLICDACEKAYHLKCLQANNMKGVPKSEWHCSRCVQAFNGKPFPPKYGRAVTTTTTKMPSSSAGVQSSTEKKVGSIDIKVNQQKPVVTISSGVQNFHGFVSAATTTSHIETASVNANTIASAAQTTNIGPQGFTNSTAPLSDTETTSISSTSAVKNNGLMSSPAGTVNATTNATPSSSITASLLEQAPKVTGNGDSSSTVSRTADDSILNTNSTTQVHALTVTSSSHSKPSVSHSETGKATEDAAICQALNSNGESQATMENVVSCENPSESETPEGVISEQGLKISDDREPFMPQENSASETHLVSSNNHSQTEKETANVQDSLENVPGDSHDGKSLNGLVDKHQEQLSETEFDKSDTIN